MISDSYNGSYALSAWTLRGMTYAQRQAAKAKRSAYLANMREEKRAVQRTCQICARPIFAERGTIAHHGYTRPGWGYQTASCYGALHLPFERSRDALGAYIARCAEERDASAKLAVEIAEGRAAVYFRYGERIRNRDMTHTTIPRRVEVTADSWPWIQACFLAKQSGNSPVSARGDARTFESIRDAAVRHAIADSERYENERAQQQVRFDLWEQTEGLAP